MIRQEVYAMRLTKEVRQKLLEQNEGFQRTTYFESNNSYNTNTYHDLQRTVDCSFKGGYQLVG